MQGLDSHLVSPIAEQIIASLRWQPLSETIRQILMSADMRKGNDSRCDRPTTMMVSNWRMLFIQRRFNVCGVLHHAFIFTIRVCRFAFWQWHAETTQLETQVFNGFEAHLQGNELGGKCTRFDRLLSLAVPEDWCSVKEDIITGMWSSSDFVRSMGSINEGSCDNTTTTWSWNLVWQRLLSIAVDLVQIFFRVWNSPKSIYGISGERYSVNFGCFLNNAKMCSSCSKWPSLGLAWYWERMETSSKISTRPISVAHRSTPISTWKNVTSSSLNSCVTSNSGL